MKPEVRGMISLACAQSVAETAQRLEELLRAHEVKIFARIDHAAEARAVGLAMRPTVLLVFGNPKIGTPLMVGHPSLALDLPSKALVWESEEGRVWLSYNDPQYLQQRHGLEEAPMGELLASFAIVADGKVESGKLKKA